MVQVQAPHLGLLEEAAVLQVLFDDDVGDGVKHKLDVFCVCGAGHVGVDLLDVTTHVQVQELHFDVVAGVLIGVGTCQRGRGRGRKRDFLTLLSSEMKQNRSLY